MPIRTGWCPATCKTALAQELHCNYRWAWTVAPRSCSHLGAGFWIPAEVLQLQSILSCDAWIVISLCQRWRKNEALGKLVCLPFSNYSCYRSSLHKDGKESKTRKADAIRNQKDKYRYANIHSARKVQNVSGKAIRYLSSVKISLQSGHTDVLSMLRQMHRICHMLK